MKELIALPIGLIFDFIGDFVLKPLLDTCPPLTIFFIAFCCIISGNGCAMIIGGLILIPIGIIAMIVWLIF